MFIKTPLHAPIDNIFLNNFTDLVLILSNHNKYCSLPINLRNENKKNNHNLEALLRNIPEMIMITV